MKRPIAACLLAGIVLAASTTAFATPVQIWNQTVDVGLIAKYQEGTITPAIWEQPFGPVLDPGWTYEITSAQLTINAGPVSNPYETNLYLVLRGPSDTGPWTSTGVRLVDGTGNTTIDFGTASWLTGDFWVEVKPDPLSGYGWPNNNWNVTINTSKLVVMAELIEPLPPDPPEPPVIPAPGAVLLAGIGAGLVSWLRARKTL